MLTTIVIGQLQIMTTTVKITAMIMDFPTWLGSHISVDLKKKLIYVCNSVRSASKCLYDYAEFRLVSHFVHKFLLIQL